MGRSELQFESRLGAAADTVWRAVSCMDGVNAELAPLLRMTHPSEYRELSAMPLGRTAFASWLLLFGVVPVDRHLLGLERVLPGQGFDERSRSWAQREWVHRRRVLEAVGGCLVRDELSFAPRIEVMRPLLSLFVRAVFAHRHRRLRARFGLPAP